VARLKLEWRNSSGRTLGFSLVELMIVIAIIICVSVVSLPTMLHVVADVRTRSTMASLSGIVQECRSYAIKTNKIMTVHFTTQGGQSVAYIQDAAAPTASLANAEKGKVAYLGTGVTKVTTPTGPSPLTATQMWQSSTLTPNTNEISFNSRGLPCYYNTSNTPATCDLNLGFVYYFTYQPPYGANGWTALSVSPAGRIKNWMWSGSKWGN
jgi:Tfp pilus assembly protein FimT